MTSGVALNDFFETNHCLHPLFISSKFSRALVIYKIVD